LSKNSSLTDFTVPEVITLATNTLFSRFVWLVRALGRSRNLKVCLHNDNQVFFFVFFVFFVLTFPHQQPTTGIIPKLPVLSHLSVAQPPGYFKSWSLPQHKTRFSSKGKLRGEPATRWFDESFAPIGSSNERFARQYRYRPPSDFRLTSSWPPIDHHLSGPLRYTLIPIFQATGGRRPS